LDHGTFHAKALNPRQVEIMKTTYCLRALLAVGLLAVLGCSKSEPPSGPPTEFYGVKVDLAKLDSEFATAAQELQDPARKIRTYFRYGQFAQAAAELEQLAQKPALTESQKKVLSTVLEQTKQVIAKVPAPTGR